GVLGVVEQIELRLLSRRLDQVMARTDEKDLDSAIGNARLAKQGILRQRLQVRRSRPVQQFRINVKRQFMRSLLAQLVLHSGSNGKGVKFIRAQNDSILSIIFGDESGGCLALDKIRPFQRINQKVTVGLGTEKRGFG